MNTNTVVMNMNGCDIEYAASMIERYGEEIMSAGWNPQLALMGASPLAQSHANLLSDFAGMDIDAFVKKLYEYQR